MCPDTPEDRPQNQLLRQPSRKDFDSWMLKELQKYRKDGDSYEDVFSLACQPRMLEIAFLSLRKRRPGTVPKALESNFFEMVPSLVKYDHVCSLLCRAIGESHAHYWRFEAGCRHASQETTHQCW